MSQYPLQYSNSDTSDEQIQQECHFCTYYNTSFPLEVRLQQFLFQQYTPCTSIYKKIVQNIIFGYENKYKLNYNQAMIDANYHLLNNIQYKNWKQIVSEIKLSIEKNLNKIPNYNKFYFGQKNNNTMMRYQLKIKALNSSNKFKSIPKFKINNLSALSTDSQEKMLLNNSQLYKKYDFYPVQELVENKKQKNNQQFSNISLAKLNKQLSILINEHTFSKDSYPDIKSMYKPYLNFQISAKQLKFRKKLSNSISEINDELNKKSNIRLYTSPEAIQNSDQTKRYASQYGYLFQNPENIKKKKKSFLKTRFSRQKSFNTSKKMIVQKTSRMTTEIVHIQSPRLKNLIDTNRSKSKSKLKISRNKLIMPILPISSEKLQRIKSEKSLNKSKKTLKMKF